jgi:hypothetical protein
MIWFIMNEANTHLGMDGKMVLKCVLKRVVEYVVWIKVGQDRDQWRLLVNETLDSVKVEPFIK